MSKMWSQHWLLNLIMLKENRLFFQFFDKTSPNALLYQFPTSDCVIKAKTPRSITVNSKKAIAIYTITGEASNFLKVSSDSFVIWRWAIFMGSPPSNKFFDVAWWLSAWLNVWRIWVQIGSFASDSCQTSKIPKFSLKMFGSHHNAIYFPFPPLFLEGDGPQPCLKRKERRPPPPIIDRQMNEEVKLDQVLLVNDRESMYRRAVQHTNTAAPPNTAASLLPKVPIFLLLSSLPIYAFVAFRWLVSIGARWGPMSCWGLHIVARNEKMRLAWSVPCSKDASVLINCSPWIGRQMVPMSTCYKRVLFLTLLLFISSSFSNACNKSLILQFFNNPLQLPQGTEHMTVCCLRRKMLLQWRRRRRKKWLCFWPHYNWIKNHKRNTM